ECNLDPLGVERTDEDDRHGVIPVAAEARGSHNRDPYQRALAMDSLRALEKRGTLALWRLCPAIRHFPPEAWQVQAFRAIQIIGKIAGRGSASSAQNSGSIPSSHCD